MEPSSPCGSWTSETRSCCSSAPTAAPVPARASDPSELEARMARPDTPTALRIGSTLLAVSALGMLAAPVTIMASIPDLTTRSSRHALAGALGLAALAATEFVLAIVPVRGGERWALWTAALPLVIVGIPILMVDTAHVAPERLWNTLAPQVAGLAVGSVSLALCAVGLPPQKR